MMSIVILFWMFVILFAIVGWMRGWAKELLVSFSVILALALNHDAILLNTERVPTENVGAPLIIERIDIKFDPIFVFSKSLAAANR